MKTWIRRIVVSIIVVMLTSQPVYVEAEEADSIQVESVGFEEGEMNVYLNRIGESEVNLDTVKVFIDNMQVPVNSVQNVDYAKVPISYYCLVDVSGSVDEERLASTKEMINGIVDFMKSDDNMKIATIADDFVTSGYYMSNPDEIRAYIDNIERTHQDTNLFYAINECLTSLAGDADVNPCRCLIVFSDGAEEQDTGITRNEVIERNKELKICIYTVAMLKAKPSDDELEAAKVLGSFARMSPGGVHFSPVLDGMEESEVSQAILQQISRKYYLNCQLQDLFLTGEKSAVKVELALNNGTTYEDYLEKTSTEITEHVIYTPEPEMETEEEIIEESCPDEEMIPSIETDQEEVDVSSILLVALILVCVVLIVTIVLLVILQKKKKARKTPIKVDGENENSQKFISQNQERVPEDVGQGNYVNKYADGGIVSIEENRSLEKKPKASVDAVITLTKIGRKKEQSLTIELQGECSVGRSKQKSKFVIADDKALSGLHCTFFFRNGAVWIRDEHSSNGTFVNGVPTTGEFKLSQDDVIYIGSYEYRITWQES